MRRFLQKSSTNGDGQQNSFGISVISKKPLGERFFRVASQAQPGLKIKVRRCLTVYQRAYLAASDGRPQQARPLLNFCSPRYRQRLDLFNLLNSGVKVFISTPETVPRMFYSRIKRGTGTTASRQKLKLMHASYVPCSVGNSNLIPSILRRSC